MRVCPSAPSVSHLLFADGSLILIRAKGEDAQQLQHILNVYEMCSGQVINKQKLAVLFSSNKRQADKRAVMDALQLRKETMNDRYLGLPVYVGESKSK